MATDSGFNNQKKKGTAQFETVQSLGSSKYGKSTAQVSLYDKKPETAIVSVQEVIGKDGQLAAWQIEFTAHTAIVGDILKTKGFEFEIVEIVDADKFKILPVSEFTPALGDLAIIKSWVTAKASPSGDASVTLTDTPTLYQYNGVAQKVTQDTTNAANNRALPAASFIIKDGVQVPIKKDTVTPANTVGLPVEIVAASGTPINITAGDINVSTSSTNDSMAIGDPITGNKVEVIVNTTGSQSLSVIDEDNIIQTTAINTKLNEVKTKQDTGNVSLNSIDLKTPALVGGKQPVTISNADSSILVSGQSAIGVAPALNPVSVSGVDGGGLKRHLLTDTSGRLQVASAQSLPLPSGAATEAKQDTGNTSLSSIDGKLTTLNAKDFSTAANQTTGNSSLSSIDNKTPTLGQKAMAGSQPVVIASDQTAIPVTGSFTTSSVAGVLDPTNSSTTPLGANAVFTGAAFDITGYVAINVNVKSDVPSATNGVTLQVSPDGTNWDHSHSTTYTAATGVGYIFNAEYRYARVVYTNGGTAQAYFRLQTIFKNTLTTSSLYTLSQTVNSNMFAQLNRSIITGETTGGGGGYVNVKVNPSGALTTESTVTGSVSVTNFPATQPVSGSVSVSNFPATQAVTGTFWQATQPVSGSVSVSNFPATQAVTGTFWQAIQPVSGSVSVSNFPSTQNTTEQTQSGTITQVQKSVGLTAVRATVSGSAPSATRKKLMLKPSKNNTGSIYFGSSSVTTASGMEIIGPDRLEFAFDASDYYLISDTAGQVVEIVEIA